MAPILSRRLARLRDRPQEAVHSGSYDFVPLRKCEMPTEENRDGYAKDTLYGQKDEERWD
jgi:hypothetical protein